ncbi:MAG TPA: TAXI family TRAP transporter solute-binding subunit [Polyangia bacterium]|nr:TAXI family TRAP transporter solute-binding subunit [Polyangia bacterium]
MTSPAGPPRSRLRALSWRDILTVGLPVALVIGVAFAFAGRLVQTAPPGHIRMISGSPGSSFRNLAEKYKKIIDGHGVKVEIVPSEGALDNLRRLAEPRSSIDVGFVQGGLTEGVDISHLVSLGTVFTQPLMVYYRLPQTTDRLTELKGKRIAIGAEGSGTHALAMKMLKANDMDARNATLISEHGEEAARSLAAGKVDAAFLMGDSVTTEVMRGMREAAGVRLLSFRQADGYVRRLKFLSRMTLPEGAMDLGRDYPSENVSLVGPAVELVAQKKLHPALSDLLIAAAREIHSGPGMYRAAGEFPAPLEHEFPISDDAERYYKSGAQFLYKRLPFWLASLVDRVLVVVLPLLVIVVPATRAVPSLYRWRVRSRIYRWYGALMAIERDMMLAKTADDRRAIAQRLDDIEHAVNELKTPLSFADQLYVLRDHVAMVRRRLDHEATATATVAP